MEIRKETLPDGKAAEGLRTVLAGEVEDLEMRYGCVATGGSFVPKAPAGQARALLFLSGKGCIDVSDRVFVVDGLALFCPRHGQPFAIQGGEEPLVYLELLVCVDDPGLGVLERNAHFFPWFLPYAECKTYRERIKSEKTVSRTLLPAEMFPRLCVGSVQTKGPDQVAAHAHPMLEQIFVGLGENDCIVTAHDADIRFGAWEVLHIPLGSRHAVRVEGGRSLHYVWIDLFREGEDMSWITREHITEE